MGFGPGLWWRPTQWPLTQLMPPQPGPGRLQRPPAHPCSLGTPEPLRPFLWASGAGGLRVLPALVWGQFGKLCLPVSKVLAPLGRALGPQSRAGAGPWVRHEGWDPGLASHRVCDLGPTVGLSERQFPRVTAGRVQQVSPGKSGDSGGFAHSSHRLLALGAGRGVPPASGTWVVSLYFWAAGPTSPALRPSGTHLGPRRISLFTP